MPPSLHPKEAVRVPLDVPLEPTTRVRSTQIAASALSLKAMGYLDRYLALLPAEYHEPVLHSVPGVWLPIEIGVAHYRAAQSLDLTVDQQLAMGSAVAERVQNGLLGTLVRMAKSAGVTPWMGIEYMPKLWQRTFIGGGVAVYELGPKEARIECHGAPGLAELAYFRNGFRGMFASSGKLFCNRIYVHDLMTYALRGVIGFRVAWA